MAIYEWRKMKRNRSELAISEFRKKFDGKEFITNVEIKGFYSQFIPELNGADLRRIVYGLEKENILYTSGSGVFNLTTAETNSNYHTKQKFKPALSVNLMGIRKEIKQKFPLLDCILWETRILHDFMVQQPKINLLVLECEKGTEEAIFDHFNNRQIIPVYLDPDQTLMERYVLSLNEVMLISKMVSRSPKVEKYKNAAYAKIEKILIDLLVDEDRFYMYQGSELVNIYETVFANFFINEDTLITYASRRHAVEKLRFFIFNKTNLDLRIFKRGENHDLTELTNR